MMIFDFTKKEERHISQIQSKYRTRYEAVITDDERTAIRLQEAAEITSYRNYCERLRFKKIKGDPQLIIDNAKKQLPKIYESEIEPIAKAAPGIAPTAESAYKIIHEHLSLHFEALKIDEPKKDELSSLIVNFVNNKPQIIKSDAGQEYKQNVREMLENARAILDYSGRGSIAPRINPQLFGATNIEATKVPWSVDAISRNMWSFYSDIDNLQCAMQMETSPKNGTLETTAICAIDFDTAEATISKKLTPFDKRIYTAAAALYTAGNMITSKTQLYTAMGNIGKKPSAADAEKIDRSLEKMMTAVLTLDNSDEYKNGCNYPLTVYKGPLLSVEKIETTINGQKLDAIHFLREPALYSFAKQRNQISTIPKKVLDSPISKTDANLRLDDYLIERIIAAKSGHLSKKILYSTICTEVGATTKKQQSRIPEKARRFLTHYTSEKWIKGFQESNDGIEILV